MQRLLPLHYKCRPTETLLFATLLLRQTHDVIKLALKSHSLQNSKTVHEGAPDSAAKRTLWCEININITFLDRSLIT